MTNSIDFETALAESLLLANSNSKNYIRLGEIAANVKTTYGGKTLNELAKRSGIPYASLRCYRAVYLAFESDPVLLASSNFSVLQSLATHPDRATILSANPNMPRAAARKLMRDYKRSVTVPLSPTEKLGAAFGRVNRALNPLLQLSAAMTSSSDAAAAIDKLINARDKLQTVLDGGVGGVAEFVLPDPDAADFAVANLVDPVDPELAHLVEPVVAPVAKPKTKRARKPDLLSPEAIKTLLSQPHNDTSWWSDREAAARADAAMIENEKKRLKKRAAAEAAAIARNEALRAEGWVPISDADIFALWAYEGREESWALEHPGIPFPERHPGLRSVSEADAKRADKKTLETV